MKRYDVTTEYNNGVMEEDPDGDYVKVEDVKAFVQKLHDEHGQSEDEEDDYCMVRWHLEMQLKEFNS